MTTANYEKFSCPVARCLSVLGDQWTFLIVRDSFSGKTRFSEFEQSLGISKNLLSTRLAHLCDQGILKRCAIPGSKRYEYVPTEKCLSLRPVILSMATWGNRWFADERLTTIECTDKNTGHPVRLGFVDTKTKQQVSAARVKLEKRKAE